MEPILQAGLEASRWLQQNYPQLQSFMELLSQLGTVEFYLVILPFFYWSVSKRNSIYLLILILITGTIQGIAKHFLRQPRPFWLDNSLGSGDDLRYGFPSGHVQMATVFYIYLAYWGRRGWLTLLAIVMILLMALSRVYLGVHFLHDIIFGFIFSLLIFVAFLVWRQRYEDNFRKRILGQRLLYALLIPIGLAVFYIIGYFLIGEPDISVEWSDYMAAAEREGIDDVVAGVSGLVGLLLGALLEGSRIRFRSDGPVWKRIGRYLLGIIIVLLVWGGLRAVFPEEPLWLALPLRFIRYGLTMLFITYFLPLLFVRTGLADANPEPELSLKL